MAKHERTGRPIDHRKDEAILNAARALLFSKSPHSFSIDAVAHKANVSKVTLYARYANRSALIDATVQHQAKKLTCSIAIKSENHKDLKKGLSQFGIDLLTFLLSEEYLTYMRAISGMHEINSESSHQIYQRGPLSTLNTLTSWLQQANLSGLANFPFPGKSAELLIGMLIGLDMIRAMYGKPCQHSGDEIENHVYWVVNAFLSIDR